MLSTTAEYALRIMVLLATSNGAPTTSERIASTAGVPTDYSIKVLQMLARKKLVRAQRGRGGGFRMACDPATTSLLDIVVAIESLERRAGGERPDVDAPDELFRLHDRIDAVLDLARAGLAQTTLHSLVDTEHPPPLEPVVTARSRLLDSPAGSVVTTPSG